MTVRFLADEHVKRAFTTALRANGYDVATVNEDFDPGRSDAEHVERARESDRVIISNDSDFVVLHREYNHGGIVLYNDQTVAVPEFVQAIKRTERFVPESDLRGSLFWLDEWIG